MEYRRVEYRISGAPFVLLAVIFGAIEIAGACGTDITKHPWLGFILAFSSTIMGKVVWYTEDLLVSITGLKLTPV